MNIKNSIGVIERAEKAGVEIVVDGTQWEGPVSSFPLDPLISPVRCELVAEARRLVDLLGRPKRPPEGSEYRHAAADIEAAVKRAAAYIKENGNVQRSETVAESDEQPADAGDIRASGRPVESAGADAGGAGKTGKSKA